MGEVAEGELADAGLGAANEPILAGWGDEFVVLGIAGVAEVEFEADVWLGGVAQGDEFAEGVAGLDGEDRVGGGGVALLGAGDRGVEDAGGADGEIDAVELLLERSDWGGGVLSDRLRSWEAEEA